MNKVTSLNDLLQEIAKERYKNLDIEVTTSRCHQKVNLARDLHWAVIFKSIFGPQSVFQLINSGFQDDIIFIVGQTSNRSSKPDLRILRRSSPNVPLISDISVNWENTVYLNLIAHCFVYILTLGMCTRSGAQEMEILRKKSLVVYACPSYRQMDSKGTNEEIVYPHVVFSIDNFEEVFEDCILRDSECLCVELTAYDSTGALQGVLFEAVVRYGVLKSAHDVDICSRGSWRLTPMKRFSANESGSGTQRTFARMLARRSEGIAEVTIEQIKPTAPPVVANSPAAVHRRLSAASSASIETEANAFPERDGKVPSFFNRPAFRAYRSATSSPLHGSPLYSQRFQQQQIHLRSALSRRGSRASLACGGRGASRVLQLVAGGKAPPRACRRSPPCLRISQCRKARSDSGQLNVPAGQRFRPGGDCIEIDSSTFQDEFNDRPMMTVASPTTEAELEKQTTFGQAWQWFKERRRITSPPIKVAVTFVSLPWYLIVSGILEAKKTPVLTSSFMENLNNTGGTIL